MNCILMHKDIPVLSYTTHANSYVLNILDIWNYNHIPLDVLPSGKKASFADSQMEQKLDLWLRKRTIPKNRKDLNEALKELGVKSSDELARKSFYLSFDDHYWVNTENKSITWDKINFYENPFSADVGNVLFDRKKPSANPNLCSPDSTLSGFLPKKWMAQNGYGILKKGGSGTEQNEPVNEVLASKIYKLLDIPHTEYFLSVEENQYYCSCKNFTTPNIEYITANSIYGELPNDKVTGALSYDVFIKRCKELNISNFEDNLSKMFIVDYMIANEDRHTGNFGLLRDSNSLDFLSLVPVYDSGSSMFYNKVYFELNEKGGRDSSIIKAKPFAVKQKEQLDIIINSNNNIAKTFDLTNLNGIDTWYRNLLEPLKRIPEEKKDVLVKILVSRIEETKNILVKKSLLIENPLTKDSNPWQNKLL